MRRIEHELLVHFSRCPEPDERRSRGLLCSRSAQNRDELQDRLFTAFHRNSELLGVLMY